jgi:hypothetical protein
MTPATSQVGVQARAMERLRHGGFGAIGTQSKKQFVAIPLQNTKKRT